MSLRALMVLSVLIGSSFATVRADEPAQPPASAPTLAPANPADTGFMMISSALVMLMTPGLGLFYGGMVRRKNVLATFQQSFIMLGVIALQWMLFGYSLAFGPTPSVALLAI